ncbi:MAG: aldo/keto reductase [Defluviitaleaceae bacterium]|nr:aldo/keto reductase [Defluviitaleaceae bacterium]
MEKIIFGQTDLQVSRTGFGAIPIQRISYDESTAILRRAVESGINLFDTANAYTTSEERIGVALGDVREKIILCTKSGAQNPADLTAQVENSLVKMRTEYIDVFQFHCPGFVPRPDGNDGLYNAAEKLKSEGKIRHIGITAHKKHLALEAIESELYAVLQYPFSYLSSPEELALAEKCREKNIGVLGMKALCGGILTNARAAFAFLQQHENIVPIWGIQHMHELEEFIAYEKSPPELTDELLSEIEADKAALAGSFCRACGYCLPCPANIPIPMAARMEFLLGRMVAQNFRTPEWQENMRRIDNCTNCGHCKANCPYELDVPELLRRHQDFYFSTHQGHSYP